MQPRFPGSSVKGIRFAEQHPNAFAVDKQSESQNVV